MQLKMRKAAPADVAVVRNITDRAYAVWTPVLGHPPQPVVEDHAPRIARGEVMLACEQHTRNAGLDKELGTIFLSVIRIG